MSKPVLDPRISVVVSSYSAPDRLQLCLDSISRQLFPAYEVIVADDVSPDADTLAGIATSRNALFVQGRDERRVQDGLPVRDIARALNHAVSLTAGDILVTLQQDHILAPDYLLWLHRCITPDTVMFGLTDHLISPHPQFLSAVAATLHLPDEENRYASYAADGRAFCVEFTDWRATDGLDSALARDCWIDLDLDFPPSGHVWMDHMLQLQLSGLRFVINPMMRLWHWDHPGRDTNDWNADMDHMLQLQLSGLRFVINPMMRLWHWDHPGRDTNDWNADMDRSTLKMQEKHGPKIFVSWFRRPLATARPRREHFWKALGLEVTQ